MGESVESNISLPFLGTVILGIILVGCVGSNINKPVPEDPPNIVVILADDMRRDYLATYGENTLVHTPNLDRLASNGALFENAYVTTAACTPSRTTILTGLYERKHGVTFGSNSSMTENAFLKTYPMLLKEKGYYTGYIGKNHTPVGKSDKGFGYKSGRMEEFFDYWYAGHKHLGFYPKRGHKVFRNAESNNQIDIIQEGTDNFFNQDTAFSKTINYLKSRPKDKPFCLLVNFNVPHGAGTSTMKLLPEDPELYRTAYRDQIDQMPVPLAYVPKDSITTPKIPVEVYNGEYIRSYNYVKTRESLKERLVRTHQTVTGIDNLVGEVIAELEREEELDNTIIVFLSDHGLQFGEHGLGGKVLLYEQSVKIPMIIYDPRVPQDARGKKVDDLCATIDIAPTLLDLAGFSVPIEMQGNSIKPLLYGTNSDWREDLFYESMMTTQNYPRMEAIRRNDWKYIRYYSKDKDQHHIKSLVAPLLGEKPIYEELYNIKNDPQELQNVAEKPINRERLEKMRSRCDEMLREARGGSALPETYIEDIVQEELEKIRADLYFELK